MAGLFVKYLSIYNNEHCHSSKKANAGTNILANAKINPQNWRNFTKSGHTAFLSDAIALVTVPHCSHRDLTMQIKRAWSKNLLINWTLWVDPAKIQSFSIQSCAGPAMGFCVGCMAFKSYVENLGVYFYDMSKYPFNKCYMSFHSWPQVCKWFEELVFISLVMMSSDDLCHWAKITDI